MSLSRHTRRYLLEGLALAALTVAVALPWGCSTSPVSPTTSPAATFALPNGVIAYPGLKHDETEVVDQGTLGLGPVVNEPLDATNAEDLGIFGESLDANGGNFTMDLEGEMSYFSVDEGSLNKTENITVHVYRDLNAVDVRITEFHFSPEGLIFRTPAELSYRTPLKDGEKLRLFWWKKDARQWVLAAEAVVVDGYATFPITHFSEYRTTERISLGGQARQD